MFEVQRIRELAELMAEQGLSEIRLREGEDTITLRRGPSGEPVVWTSHATPMTAHAAPPSSASPAQSQASSPAAAADANLIPITSPMVGTFYSAPDPESPAFVRVGSDVGPDTPVCIIEAMKVFNEIKSEVSGTIERILVKDEQAVEFGQPLMLVKPKT